MAAKHDDKARLVLAMLLIVYVFNFLDRMLLSILFAPTQADLKLSDGQMGLLGGLAFAVLYSTLAVPLSWLADRSGRARVIGWQVKHRQRPFETFQPIGTGDFRSGGAFAFAAPPGVILQMHAGSRFGGAGVEGGQIGE